MELAGYDSGGTGRKAISLISLYGASPIVRNLYVRSVSVVLLLINETQPLIGRFVKENNQHARREKSLTHLIKYYKSSSYYIIKD